MKLFLRVVVVLATLGVLCPPCLSSPLYLARRFKKKSNEEQTQTYWKEIAKDELNRAIRLKHNNNKAKNVIMFLGDGMSIPSLTAGRIYKGQLSSRSGEEGSLVFEQLPHVGLAKTYNVDKQVPDSASTATAYLTGVKTNYKTIGVDGSAVYQDCHSVTDSNKVSSIAKWAQDAGKKTGVVTSTRITHATPAGTYAHVADRDWECDGNVPDDCKVVVKDIARQLVEDEPGSLLNVVMGGGYQCLSADATGTDNDPLDDDYGCIREDNKNLADYWVKTKKEAGLKHAFVRTNSSLQKVDTSEVDYLMGIFANGHLPYEYEKREKNLDVPTLAEMTKTALQILERGSEGYFLLVEGGRIDHAHHDTMAHRALDELVAMDDAVEIALAMTNQEETLIVVTADHAHTMSISGYPKRGQDIIGLAGYDDMGYTYTTLMYANGPGYNDTRFNITEDTRDWEYTQLATVYRGSETHGGDDVAIYALGPMAHLFHGLHEQNYIPEVMAYSACIGDYKDDCHSGGVRIVPALTVIILAAFTRIFP